MSRENNKAKDTIFYNFLENTIFKKWDKVKKTKFVYSEGSETGKNLETSIKITDSIQH